MVPGIGSECVYVPTAPTTNRATSPTNSPASRRPDDSTAQTEVTVQAHATCSTFEIREGSRNEDVFSTHAVQSVSQGFICEIINKRANTCDPTIEEYSSRSSMIRCLGLVWSACAYRVPCLPKLVLLGQRWTKARVSCTSVYAPACPSLQGHPVHCRSRLAMVNWATGPASR